MNSEDLKQIRFMLQSAQAALVFAEGKTQEKLFSDTRLIFALAKALDLITTSAEKVSPEGRAAAPQVNWKYVLQLEDQIYLQDDINLSIVWEAVTNEIPSLAAQLQHILLVNEKPA